ncbi:MAG: hypothetical protein U1D55_17025 [Phycisphaerae bacterium]
MSAPRFLSLLLAAAALAPAGCVVVSTPPPPPEPIKIELYNPTSGDVRPNLFVSATALDETGLFVGGNQVTNFTTRPFPELRAGETATVTVDCDTAASIGVDKPVLFIASTLAVTNSADRIFLLRDTDVTCGRTVRFVYFTEDAAFRVRRE